MGDWYGHALGRFSSKFAGIATVCVLLCTGSAVAGPLPSAHRSSAGPVPCDPDHGDAFSGVQRLNQAQAPVLKKANGEKARPDEERPEVIRARKEVAEHGCGMPQPVKSDEELDALRAKVRDRALASNVSLVASRWRKDAKKAKVHLCGMTDEEIWTIVDYIDAGYEVMNRALRAGKGPELERLRPQVELLDYALSRLPDHVGEVVRGAELPPEILDTYQPGGVVADPAFLSTTAGEPFPGTLFRIKSKHCKSVQFFNPEEKEVLCRPNTRMKVLKIDEEKTYFLEEQD